ncbi:MAG: PAS domain S-box protein, partial [Desulfobacteraceae bacterium]|nr:PAS domain S-box protein [Desulfobacteraceae bacterium]
LDAIIKTVPDIIYRLDADGRITFISDAVKQYGYRPETLLGTSIVDLVYHEDKDKVKDRMNERRTGDIRTSSFEVRLLTKDQENVLFEIFSVSAEGLYSSESPTQSTFRGTQGIARDITERKQTEKALQENEKKYRTLFDSSADAISIINLDTGKFIDCNNAAVKLHDTGNRENFLGLMPDQLSPKFQPNGELSSKLSAEYIQTAFKEGVKVFEWTHCRSDGTQFPVSVTLSAMKLGGKNFVLAFGKDITERKQAEEGREKLINELQEALEKIKTLSGLVPICANCKKIRDDNGYWNQIEEYIQKRSEATFSHGLCPECSDALYGKERWYIKAKKKKLENKS